MTSTPSLTPLPTSADDYGAITDYTDYNDNDTYVPNKPTPLCIHQAGCFTLLVVNAIIVLLGLLGNGLVIWVIGFKMKKRTVASTWYLSLAFSDFIFSATFTFNISQQATGSWNFGLFMCKFTSFVLFLNMFSSIFLMLLISVDRCVAVVFAIWAYRNRTMKRAAAAVVVAWLFSMLLSIPSLVSRDIIEHNQVYLCYNNFEKLPFSSTSLSVFRFVLGFVFPLVIITVCYSVIIKRIQNNRMARSSMPFKVMTALIVIFLICWLPYHIFNLLDISHHRIGLMISVTLVLLNSCLNPFLYAFMGNDIKQRLLKTFSLKTENAFSEGMSENALSEERPGRAIKLILQNLCCKFISKMENAFSEEMEESRWSTLHAHYVGCVGPRLNANGSEHSGEGAGGCEMEVRFGCRKDDM